MTSEQSELLRTELGSYAQYAHVASGGFGSVFFGRDLQTNRAVAIKRLHGHLAYQPPLVERFIQEAARLRGLEHPNIVQVLDDGTDRNGLPFIVLQWVEGWTIAKLLEEKGRFAIDEAVTIATQVLDALDAAGRRGVVHRDIKPANLMLTPPPDRRVKVMDFGIAKDVLADGSAQHTQIGTIAYMAPEQFNQGRVDARTDVYALGVTLYELLSGQRPAPALAPEPHTVLRERRPEVDMALSAIVYRALEPRPADRFQTAAEMRAALAPFTRRGVDLTALAPSASPVELERDALPPVGAIPFVAIPTVEPATPATPTVEPAQPATPRDDVESDGPPAGAVPLVAIPIVEPTSPVTRRVEAQVSEAPGATPSGEPARPAMPTGEPAPPVTPRVEALTPAAFEVTEVGSTRRGSAHRSSDPESIMDELYGRQPAEAVATPPDQRERRRTGTAMWIGLAVAALVLLVVAQQLTTRFASQPGEPTPVPVVAPTQAPIAAPTQAPVAAPTQPPTQAPVVAPTQAPIAAPTQVPAAAPTQVPTSIPTVPATSAPTATAAPTSTLAPTPAPTIDELWLATLARIDQPWAGRNWPVAIAALDAFQSEHPGHAAAQDKLYAARLFYAEDFLAVGARAEAAAQLSAASELLPERPEAPQALLALTPTAVPTTVAPQPVPQPKPAPPAPKPTSAPAPAPAPPGPAPTARPIQP